MFKLDSKMVVNKINTAYEDLTKLENITAECRKILITHSSCIIRFVKRQTMKLLMN